MSMYWIFLFYFILLPSMVGLLTIIIAELAQLNREQEAKMASKVTDGSIEVVESFGRDDRKAHRIPRSHEKH